MHVLYLLNCYKTLKDEIIPLEANEIANKLHRLLLNIGVQDLKNSEGIVDFPWVNVTKEI